MLVSDIPERVSQDPEGSQELLAKRPMDFPSSGDLTQFAISVEHASPSVVLGLV